MRDVRSANWRLPAGLAGLGLVACLLLMAAPTAQAAPKSFVAGTSGHNSERIETVQIERDAKSSRRVAFSLDPKRMPDLRKGDLLEGSGEVTLTTTCVDSSSRCIGRGYSFSPRLGAQLVLAKGADTTGGKRAVPVGRRIAVKCRQDRPHRNHHCPLVISSAKLRADKLNKLPCKPSRCRLNLVVDAHHKRARDGQVVVVGADRPGGDVDQNKGRVNALVRRADNKPKVQKRKSKDRVNKTLPMGFSGSGGHKVVFSVKLPKLRKGDAILATAKQVTNIGHLGYPAFISGELIVATSRNKAKSSGLARKAITYNGNLGAANGFNCTQGSSGYRTPCVTRKVALGTVTRNVVNKKGRNKPLFVNLISRTFPKRTSAGSGDAAIIAGGGIKVERYVR